MVLDLSSLQKAIRSYDSALRVANRILTGESEDAEKEVIKAGVIQNFEFTYELCWKFIKRWLAVQNGGAFVEGLARKDLFRLAFEYHLINSVKKWFEYHEARNDSSHTYNQSVAADVFSIALVFIKDAKFLYDFIKTNNAA